MELKEIIEKRSDFAAKKVGDEMVLVPVKDSVASMNVMFTLNEVGTFVWECLAEKTNEAEILDKLTEEFDIDRNTAEKDLHAFIEQLEQMING